MSLDACTTCNLSIYECLCDSVYPCGCLVIRHKDGSYDHFIHPKCTLDAGKTTKLPTYRYKNWDSLPNKGRVDIEKIKTALPLSKNHHFDFSAMGIADTKKSEGEIYFEDKQPYPDQP